MNLTHGGNLFAVARAHGWDWRDIADFSASINPLGPAPGVLDAIRNSLDRIAHYPEREPADLLQALATQWSIKPENLLLGNGATELIHFLARAGAFKDVTLAVPVFSEFHRAFSGARTVSVHDKASWPREGVFVLTQPLNPTGELLDLDNWLGASASPVLIDESFLEFTGQPSTLRLIGSRPNLYVLRSLTKFYALPGLRVGALAAAPDDIARLRAHREPWQVNALAEQAALAALKETEHAKRTLEFITAEREWLRLRLATLPGLQPQPSSTNYLFIALGYEAAPLVRHFLAHKILIRDCSGWPGVTHPSAVRIAVRTRAENERLLAAWEAFPCD